MTGNKLAGVVSTVIGWKPSKEVCEPLHSNPGVMFQPPSPLLRLLVADGRILSVLPCWMLELLADTPELSFVIISGYYRGSRKSSFPQEATKKRRPPLRATTSDQHIYAPRADIIPYIIIIINLPPDNVQRIFQYSSIAPSTTSNLVDK